VPFSALLDANVLIPNLLRDTLLRIAERGLYRPLWSAQILDETRRNVLRLRPDVDQHRLRRTFDNMNEAFEDALVSGHETIIESMTNDPKDRHVLAAAVVGRADVIVTFNLKDFPVDSVAPYDIEVQHPDTFLSHQYDLAPRAVSEVLREQSADTRRPPLTVTDLLEALKRAGAEGFAELAAARA
jgi:predicted nucleic acid-binding protein